MSINTHLERPTMVYPLMEHYSATKGEWGTAMGLNLRTAALSESSTEMLLPTVRSAQIEKCHTNTAAMDVGSGRSRALLVQVSTSTKSNLTLSIQTTKLPSLCPEISFLEFTYSCM